MASLFDQYEQASSYSSGYTSGKPAMPEMITAGIINANLEDDVPMFSKKRINFSPSDSITHLKVCNNILALGMRSKIKRLDIMNPEKSDDFDLQKITGEKVKIFDLFLDRTGQHLIASLVSHDHLSNPSENLYLYHAAKKPQHCSKMKGHVISSVAFNPAPNTYSNTTGLILVGTTKGIIFETELASGDDRTFFQSSPEQYFKQVFDIGVNADISTDSRVITGLVFHNISGINYHVFATTASRLFHFKGTISGTDPPSLQNVFNCYKGVPESYIEFPGNLPYSVLQLYYPNKATLPVSFAWMVEPGIMYTKINFTVEVQKMDRNLLLYPEDKTGEKRTPLSIVLTEFHVLVLYSDRIKALCVLNQQLVSDDLFAETYGSLKGLVKDPEKGSIWVFSDQAIYKYKIFREDRHMWEIYMNKKDYDAAKTYCKRDPVKIDKVLSRQAEDLFKRGKYEESAVIYAQTYISFEEITLKFLEARQEKALRKLLITKLEGLKNSDKAQITMITMWLMEIFLNELGVMRTAEKQTTEEYKSLQREFRTVFQSDRIKECVSNNRSAVYNLISSHGDEENLIYFTNFMRDHQKVIQYHLQHKNYKAALAVLSEHSRPELFYQFSPALMQTHPKETVDAWIAQDSKLDPVQLIPSLVHYDSKTDARQGSEAIRYLEFCVYEMYVIDQAIHNYLITLYTRFEEAEKLMAYLQQQNELMIPFDQKYALRICSEVEGFEKACVHIYSTMGLFEEAVDLALKVDVDSAKQIASRPEASDDLRKKLWLKIAKHVVKEENDIKRAMEFLQECDLIKIEDILPFFPDFVTIDHFKDAICSSLQDYNQHIESLKEEMEVATQSTEEIRAEMHTFRNRYSMVTAQEKCVSCGYPIMGRSFYLFPCKHVFHSICMVAEVLPYHTPAKQNRISEIQRQLAVVTGQEDTASLSSQSLISSSNISSKKDKLNAELDDLVASECLYCGDIMIRSIDCPFVNLMEYSAILQSWE